MTESIALDTLRVPENAVNSRGTGAKKQGCNKYTGLIIILSVVSVASTTGFITLSILYQFSRCCCPDEWIGFQEHCYYFSTHEMNWTSSRKYCLAEHADLTVMGNTTDVMDFLRQHKCTSDHWIGLEMEGNQMGKWVNGATFNQLFKVSGNETCAYLSDDGIATARCYTERKFICGKKKH